MPGDQPGGGGCWAQVELTDALRRETVKAFARNLLDFGVARSEELEVNQWIVQDIHWLSSQLERANNTIHCLVYTKLKYKLRSSWAVGESVDNSKDIVNTILKKKDEKGIKQENVLNKEKNVTY